MKYFFIFSIANTIQKILNNKREKERICKYTRLIIKHELDEFGEYEELFFVTESAAIDEFRRRLNNQRYEELGEGFADYRLLTEGDPRDFVFNLSDKYPSLQFVYNFNKREDK